MNTQNNLGTSHKDCGKEKKLRHGRLYLIQFHLYKIPQKNKATDIGKNDQWNGCQEFGEYLEGKNIWWWWFPSCIYVLTLSYCTFKIDNHHPHTHTYTVSLKIKSLTYSSLCKGQ